MAKSPQALVPSEVLDLAQQLAQPVAMRRGSLTTRWMKCSKPGCACAHDPEARHGPYASLTRRVQGRTQSRYVPSEQVERVGEQIAAGKVFREQVEAYWQACERWADADLEVEAPAPEGEKKGSSPPSRPRS
jgi:hypothetical protein